MLGSFLTTFSAVSEEVKEVVNYMQDQMASRLSSIEKNVLYAESTILDPRFKSRGFKNQGAFRDAVEVLKRKLQSIYIVEPTEFHTTSPTAAQENTTEGSLWDSYDVESRSIVHSSNKTVASVREVDKYLNEEYLDRKGDPLVWWNQRKLIYPKLYSFVLKRLCIVATSVPCERTFSIAGQIITDRRCLLLPEKVDQLTFLHHNM